MEKYEMSQFVEEQFAQLKETVLNIASSSFSLKKLFNDIQLIIRKEDAAKINPQPHPTVSMWFEANDCYVDIDENIAELIKEIWNADINTLMCCENNVPKDYIWIQFERQCDYDSFMTIVLNPNKEMGDITNRIFAENYISDKNWITNINHRYINNPENYNPTYVSNISLRFPKSDYEFVLGQFKKHNEKKE